MQITRENLAGSRVRLKIALSETEIEKYFKLGLKRLKEQTEIKGFRKGQAPEGIVKEKLGEQRVISEAIDIAMPQTYLFALKKEKIIPLEPPKIKVKKFVQGKNLVYEAEVSVVPKVELPNYQRIKPKIRKIKVTKNEVAEALAVLQNRMASYREKLGPAKIGDFVELDFEGEVSGVRLDRLTSRNHPLILGKTKLIPGFQEKILGLKKGEEREFKLKLPHNHFDKSLAGKEAKFKIKVRAVKKVILPEINNDFAKKLGLRNQAELRKKFQEATIKQKEERERKRAELEMINKIARQTKVDLPEVLVKQELARIFSEISRRIQMQGVKFEDYLNSISKTRKDLERELKKEAENNVRIGLTLAEIGKKEKIKVTGLEVENETKRIINEGKAAGLSEDELKKNYQSEQGKRYVENLLRNRKTIEKLKTN